MFRVLAVGLAFAAASSFPTSGFAQQLGAAVDAVLTADGLSSRTVEITDGFRDYVRQATGSRSRVFADVAAVKLFPVAGCKRIAVVVRAPEALARDSATGQQTPFRFDFEMNLCRDGSPPMGK